MPSPRPLTGPLQDRRAGRRRLLWRVGWISTKTPRRWRWRYTAPRSRSYIDRKPDVDLADRIQPDGSLGRGRPVGERHSRGCSVQPRLLAHPPIMSWLAPTPPPASLGNDRLAPQRDLETKRDNVDADLPQALAELSLRPRARRRRAVHRLRAVPTPTRRLRRAAALASSSSRPS
jgi:hypothetical protein